MNVPRVRQPRLAQTLQWILRPYEFMNESHSALGDVFEIDVIGLGRLVLVSDPAEVARIFKGDHSKLRTGEANALVKPLLGEHSLLAIDAPQHMEVRQRLAPMFSKRAVDIHMEEIQEVAHIVVHSIQTGQRIRVQDVIRRITLRAMLTVVFGETEPARFEAFYRVFSDLTGELAGVLAYMTPLQRDLGPGSLGRWFRKRREALDQLIQAELATRRATAPHGRPGVIEQLLDENASQGRRFSDTEIRDHVVTLLAAGHETVGSAIAWAIHWTYATPGVLDRARQSLESADGDTESNRYLEAVCLESMRITPIAEVVSRVNTESMEIGGFTVQPGSLVSPAIHLVHQRPDLYPDPHAFSPERFLNHTFGSSEYLPFGGGQRLCLGKTLAIEEMKIILGAFVKHLDLHLIDAPPLRGRRRNVTIAPVGGVKAIPTVRK